MTPLYQHNNYTPEFTLREGSARIGSRDFGAFIFDLEGTGVDTDPVRHEAHRQVAAQVGVRLDLSDPQSVSEISPNFYGGPGKAIMEQLAYRGNGRMTPKKMMDLDTLIYRQLVANADLQPREYLVPFLETLKGHKIPIAIASNTDFEEAREILERSKLWPFFNDHSGHLIVLRERAGDKPKPDPFIYELTAEAIGIRPTDTVVFEDSPVGVESAHKAGAFVWGVPVDCTPHTIQKLFDHGARMVATDGWSEIHHQFNRNGHHPEGFVMPGQEMIGSNGYQPLEYGSPGARK